MPTSPDPLQQLDADVLRAILRYLWADTPRDQVSAFIARREWEVAAGHDPRAVSNLDRQPSPVNLFATG